MPRRDSTEPAEVRRGFTLVELLVVVGIVSVLIAILMPALNRAREHADRVKCAANLRSIGQALTMYVQQYGRYPACQLYDSGHSPAVWPVRLRPFTNGDRGVFHCPSQDESREWRRQGAPPGGTPRWATHSHARYGYEPGELLLDWEWVPFSYGYNITGADGGFSRPPVEQLGLGVKLIVDDPAHRSSGEVRAGQVRAPSEMIAITDSMSDGWCDFMITPQLGQDTGPHGTDRRNRHPGRVHNHGANVLFCDGHVTWYLQKDLVLSGDFARDVQKYRMWNNTNRW